MQHRLLVATLLLLPACAQRYAAPASVQTSTAPDEVFQCVRRQLTSLGYKQTSIDVDEHRISATQYDSEARRADIQFRRLAHRLEVQVAPDAAGQTTIGVTSHTFAEYTTQRGPTEVEEKAADQVKTDAQKLLNGCRG
jgi:hypothetical protein